MADLLRHLMPLSSRIPFVFWRILRWPETIRVKFYSDEIISIRGRPNLDLDVAYEVFVTKIYASPRPIAADAVKVAVDVGANVGYSLVYLANCFPEADFIAFEPHPENARQASINIANNHLTHRVALNVAGAGVQDGNALLTDGSAGSRIVGEGAPIPGNGAQCVLPIEVVDFFKTVEGKQIDFLKMDCEGGEYDLIHDPRFADVNARYLVLEWHLTEQHPHADEDIRERLNHCGWEVIPTSDNRTYVRHNGLLGNGVLWGFRR